LKRGIDKAVAKVVESIAAQSEAVGDQFEKIEHVESAQGQIYVTGNTVIDALQMVVDKLRNDAALSSKQEQILAMAGYNITRLDQGKKLVLITGHRRENF
nr:hypothetical protein [Parabacteroides merdae]